MIHLFARKLETRPRHGNCQPEAVVQQFPGQMCAARIALEIHERVARRDEVDLAVHAARLELRRLQIEETAHRRTHVLDRMAADHSAQYLLRWSAGVGLLHSVYD